MRPAEQALLLCLCALLSMGACNSPEEASIQRISPVTNLRAFSIDSASVGLAWFPAEPFGTSYAADQFVEVVVGASIIDSVSLPLSATNAVIQNLTEGTVYSFNVYLRASEDSPYPSSSPATISWSPARRFSTAAGTGQPLRLYEFDSALARGITFFSDSLLGPAIHSLGSADRILIDAYFNSAIPQLRSGSTLNPGPVGRTTQFSTMVPIQASTLDHPHYFVPGTGSYSESEFNIDVGTVTSGVIIFARTQDDHYMRILLLRGPNGRLIQGTAPNRYIELQLSYQIVTGIPYAMVVSPMGALIP